MYTAYPVAVLDPTKMLNGTGIISQLDISLTFVPANMMRHV